MGLVGKVRETGTNRDTLGHRRRFGIGSQKFAERFIVGLHGVACKTPSPNELGDGKRGEGFPYASALGTTSRT